jgi:hypothetical protein
MAEKGYFVIAEKNLQVNLDTLTLYDIPVGKDTPKREIVMRSNVTDNGIVPGYIALWLIRYHPQQVRGTVEANNLRCDDEELIERAYEEISGWLDSMEGRSKN